MAEDVHSKTEEPTPKRRDEARAEGQVPQSAEVTAAAVLFAAVFAMSNRGPALVGALREVMRRLASDTVGAVWPILAVTGTVGLVVTTAQVGFRFLPKRVLPDVGKISPSKGFQRLFSKRGGVELLKALVKIALVGWITWRLVLKIEDHIVPLAASAPREILGVAGRELGHIVLWATGAISILAACDYAWQRRQHHMSLRMTKAEVKDERRQAEGDRKSTRLNSSHSSIS